MENSILHKMDPQTKSRWNRHFKKILKDTQCHSKPVPNLRSTPTLFCHGFKKPFSVIVLLKKNDAMDIPQLWPEIPVMSTYDPIYRTYNPID